MNSLMPWDDQSVLRILQQIPNCECLFRGNPGHYHHIINGVSFIILLEDIGCKFYFECPHSEDFNYTAFYEFASAAKPVLDKIIEKGRQERLMDSPGNINTQLI